MTRQMPVLVLRSFAVVRQWSAAISRGAAGRPPSRRKACAPWGRGRNARTLGRDGYMSPAYLPQKLDQPLPTKDGGTLRTIREAVDYMTGIAKKRELRKPVAASRKANPRQRGCNDRQQGA